MELDGGEMDRIVYDIVRECSHLAPTRDEIAQHVLDHLRHHMSQYILPSIQRLVDREQIIEDRDVSRGRPYRYWLPQQQRL